MINSWIRISTAPTKLVLAIITNHRVTSSIFLYFSFTQWAEFDILLTSLPIFKCVFELLIACQSFMPLISTLETHHCLAFSALDFLLVCIFTDQHGSACRFHTPSGQWNLFVSMFFQKSIVFFENFFVVYE